MLIEGSGRYFDGRGSRATTVRYVLDLTGLSLFDQVGRPVERWPMGRLRVVSAADAAVRLAAKDAGDARLEIVDPQAVKTILPAIRALPRLDDADHKAMLRLVGWFAAALVSVGILAVYGIPAGARWITQLIPTSAEVQLGESAKPQFLEQLGDGNGRVCRTPDGIAALDKLVKPLIAAADLPIPINVEVIPSKIPNAFALPGGQLVVLDGILTKLDGPDQLAGVIAHELGHVAHRDSMRRLVETAGVSILIGIVIGDFTGSTVAVLVGKSLISAGHSREAEAAADAYGIELLLRLGRDPADLGKALARISEDGPALDGVLGWFSTHPMTAARIEALKAHALEGPRPAPLLTDAEWASLRRICR
jgi:predicted Zn-dependent protease